MLTSLAQILGKAERRKDLRGTEGGGEPQMNSLLILLLTCTTEANCKGEGIS